MNQNARWNSEKKMNSTVQVAVKAAQELNKSNENSDTKKENKLYKKN